MRTFELSADLGAATIKVKDGDFAYALAHSVPSGIPFAPDASGPARSGARTHRRVR